MIAVGLSRTPFSFGFVTSGIGSMVFPLVVGSTGTSGDALTTMIGVPPIGVPVTIFTQAFLDDTTGATGTFLASNVVEIEVVP